MNRYSFVVELNKNIKKDRKFNQILFCSCGNKQNCKISIKRTILKNTENFHEDRYSVEDITCSKCKVRYDVLNYLYGIKNNQQILVEVSFSRDKIELNGNVHEILIKNKDYYYFDLKKEEIKKFTLSDFIVFDKKQKKIKLFVDESLLNFNTLNSNKDDSEIMNLIQYKSKQNKLTVFDLDKFGFFNKFFEFDGIVNFKNLDICFEFMEEMLACTYEYEFLMNEKFMSNFKISSKIHEIDSNGEKTKMVFQKDPFGTGKLIHKKLNTGDYLNKLIKLSNIVSIFVTFPQISSLYKTKGIDFIIESFHDSFFCPESFLKYNNATNTIKILESCCEYYFKQNPKNIHSFFYKKKINETQEQKLERFKLSPVLVKSLQNSKDVINFYQFYKLGLVTKIEIESLYIKFDKEDVNEVLNKIVNSSNMRSIKLELGHLNHIIKNKIFKGNEDEWLNIYYDTINTLNLIVGILKNKKEKNGRKNRYNDLNKISENKLLEIKKYEKLKELHDEMYAIYRALEDEGKDLIFRDIVKKFKNLNVNHNFFEFKVIPNLKELSQEGLIMKHCIYTYLNDIIDGNYLAIRIKDKISKEKATLGIKINDKKLHLQQLKGYENSRPSNFLINNVLNYCESNKIIIDSSHLHKTDIQPNESLEKRMKNYLSKDKAMELRKKMKNDN